MYRQTLLDYLREYAEFAPQKPLLGDHNGWLTTAQVLTRVEDTAGKLYGLGLRPEDWAVLRMTQTADAVVLLLALQAMGAVAVLTDSRMPMDEVFASAQRELPWVISYACGRWALEHNGETTALDAVPSHSFTPSTDPFGPGMVIFTSGSTGKRKGVILSQHNLISNLLASAPLGGYREDDVALGALPMDHVFGLALLTGAIVLRHCLYLTPGKDLETVLKSIETQHITRMNGVPSLYLTMAARRRDHDLSSLRCGFIGGGPCTASQFESIEEALSMTLVPVYGMSECVGIACGEYRASRAVRCSGVGRFYRGNEGKIIREDGSNAPAGESGEVCVRGPQRMIGYCDAEQTRATIDADGFLHTGDLGYLDENGILHLTGRKRDIIIRNGVNLSTRKIEEALLSIPGVKDAMVVGLSHAVQGEVPCALVQSDLTEKVLLARLSRVLHKNEIPAELHVVPSIPHTPGGKPDKVKGKELLELWEKA